MSSNLDSSLTSMDWLPQLGISSLRSGRERRRSDERDRKKDRGRERGDILPVVPDPSSSSCKGKPPHSYATLIAMAIAAAPERKLSLNDIYTWISNTFPYYSRAGRGWKVRLSWLHSQHTLSLENVSLLILVCLFFRTPFDTTFLSINASGKSRGHRTTPAR